MTPRRARPHYRPTVFGQNLRRLMGEQQLTPEQLAGHSGLDVATVREYLSGYRPGWPAVPTLLRLARTLDCTTDALLGHIRPSDELDS